jgi:hypothetical protein
LHHRWDPLREDPALACRIAAEKTADMQPHPDGCGGQWVIRKRAHIATLDVQTRLVTARTISRGLGGGDHQRDLFIAAFHALQTKLDTAGQPGVKKIGKPMGIQSKR